jgi:hypothetical protein
MASVVRHAFEDRYGINTRWTSTAWMSFPTEVTDSAVRRAAHGLYQRGLVAMDYYADNTRHHNARQSQHVRLGDEFGIRTESVYRGFPEIVEHVVALAALDVALAIAGRHYKLGNLSKWKAMLEWRRNSLRYHRRAVLRLSVRGAFSPAWAACQVLTSKTTARGGLTWWRVLRALDDLGPGTVMLPGGWANPALASPEIGNASLSLRLTRTGRFV